MSAGKKYFKISRTNYTMKHDLSLTYSGLLCIVPPPITFQNQTNVKGGIVHNAWQIYVSLKVRPQNVAMKKGI